MAGFEVVLQRVRTLSESTRDFRFVRADRQAVEFVPGQFYRFVFEDAQGEFERSYSLCNFSGGEAEGVMDLVISTVQGGRASALLFAAEPGFKARVTGPFGRLILPEQPPKRLFLLATSVGIAPYMPMLPRLLDFANEGCEVHMLYGVRDTSEFIYGDQLNEFAASNHHTHLHLCLSRCDPEPGLTASQIKGYVQDKLFDLAPNPETDHLLLCGNPKMIDDTYPRLKSLGFGVRQVVREKYVFAKEKAPGGKPKPAMTDAQKQLLAEKMKQYQKP